ncbi:hypothetical protein FSARC_14604 [Fusarium sarcochroum]|uniref:NAD-dependent epimerase/dehydratase domain-containing protein n=1 Tax=Fusarium sarcochroum TaxID=1208366 RepID=A0A8H4WN99_9HYPO|nr:hypothetical protein FSARC_14604 [Fusarium sarcochroum]
MAPLDNPTAPKGSTVLVTGVNGLLGSHIAKQFLEYDYKVRGTVRDLEKNSWLSAAFDREYGRDRFELVQVKDMMAEGAFNEAVKGVAIVVHTASVMLVDPDPNNVIPKVIDGAVNALKASYSEQSVKRFVFTSSSAAVVSPWDDQEPLVVTEDSWNEDLVKQAWADPPFTAERVPSVYGASKVQSEQAIWKYHKEHRSERPDLVVNTVIPNFNMGPSIDPINQGFPSSSSLLVHLYKGQILPMHHFFIGQYYIDVDDTGRLHVAAAIFDHVRDQRIFGFAGRFNWDEVLDVLREDEPSRMFPESFSSGIDPHDIESRDKAEQLLRDLGRPGWTSLKDSVLRTIESFRAAGDKAKVYGWDT